MINKKYVVVALVAFVSLFVGLSIFFMFPKSYIKFQTSPNQVAILIDGKDKKVVTNGDSVYITPGKHTFTIYRDEFNPQTNTISIQNGETQDFVVALIPLTDAASALINNDTANAVMEKSTGIKMDQQSKILKDLYPILNILPRSDPYYRITTCPSVKNPSDHLRIALCIDVVDASYKDSVLQEVKAAGYDLSTYEIVWSYNSD